MPQHTPWGLIAKYLAGECQPEETKVMNTWLENVDNRLLFNEIRSTWEQQNLSKNDDFDVEKGIRRLHEKMAGAEESESDDMERSSIRSINGWSWMLAAGIALLIGLSYLFLNPDNSDSETAITYVEKRSGKDEVLMFYLPDSSQVWLNKKSTIRFPKTFTGNKREIQLAGEAFFNVVKNRAKPFIVKSRGVATRVLGTSFDVRAYPSDGVATVTVATGLVEVSNTDEAGTALGKSQVTPLQKLVLEKESQTTYITSVRKGDIANWRSEPLIFRDNTYAEVTRTLEERFGIRVTMNDNQLKQCRVMANFNRGASLEEILKLLSMSNSFKYTITEDQVRISGGVCN